MSSVEVIPTDIVNKTKYFINSFYVNQSVCKIGTHVCVSNVL